jgi:hypothetical protein
MERAMNRACTAVGGMQAGVGAMPHVPKTT